MRILLLLLFSIATSSHAALSFQQYNKILDTVFEIYSPIYSSHGATFKIIRSWENEKINAKARIKDNLWWIDMWGGYAKHPLATEDGFTAFVCHEIGHHLGGFPFWNEPGAEWSSAEGQADYFAAMKCLRVLWKKKDNAKAIQNKKSQYVEERCKRSFDQLTDQALCIRIAFAGLEMIKPVAYKPEKITFETPNTWETTFTFVTQHPGSQCRVDTFLQGAICPVDERVDFDNQDETVGACTQKGHGARPRCWFLPRVNK